MHGETVKLINSLLSYSRSSYCSSVDAMYLYLLA